MERLKMFMWPLAMTILAMVGFATIVGFIGGWGWLMELTTHLRWQYLLVLVGLVIIFMVGKRPMPALLSLLFGAINLAVVLPLYVGGDFSPASTATTYRALMLNVLWVNEDVDSVKTFIQKTNADFVVLTEVVPAWEAELASLRSIYPYGDEVAYFRSSHGVMFFSRVPLVEGKIFRLQDGERPSVVAHLDFPDRPLTVIGMHPPAPVSPTRINLRNEQLAAMAEFASSQNNAVFLMGDLNITPWSPYFADFLEKSGLQNGRSGYGLQTTWPAQIPLMRIPIDHALVSPEIIIHDFKAGPNVGSDHLPIIIEFSIQPDNERLLES
ncbi:MAG: hypothetical protein DWQ04_01170 [Chloroflexi bacterium]|nr:MAG: hypothetical protein DWQ04_01170 [Chloroflexota bacterium]